MFKKQDYIHMIIVLFFMFGFGHLPPIAPLTAYGMKTVGIFIGVIWGWTAISNMMWVTFLGMFALVANGVITMDEWAPISFANSTVVYLFFIFLIVGVANETGLSTWCAAKILSLKIVEGKPWTFTLIILLASYVAAFLGSFGGVVFVWYILYTVFDKFGFKKGDRYVTLMLMGVVFAALTCCGNLLPYDAAASIVRGAAYGTYGFEVSFLEWFSASIPLGILSMLAYYVALRWIFRIDLSQMNDIRADLVNPKDLVLTKGHKLSIFFIAAYMIGSLSTGIVPTLFPGTAAANFITSVGITGVTLIVICCMMLVKIDGKPYANLKKALQTVEWNTLLIFAFAFPFGSVLTSDLTGVNDLIAGVLIPLIDGKSPIMLLIISMLVIFILTNFMNNAVLMIIWITVLLPVVESMGLNPLILCLLIIWPGQFAYLTPAASAPAAMFYSNTKYVEMSGKTMRDITVMMTFLFVVMMAVGLPYLMFLYN